MIHVAITNRQNSLRVDRRRIRRAVTAVVRDAGIDDARVSIAVVDDATIAKLHQQFLGDPSPTDVLSFLLERSDGALEGEVVASADAAAANASHYHVTAEPSCCSTRSMAPCIWSGTMMPRLGSGP